ncbi:MAG TPA: Ig-like domain-containing protein, partial [Anaerolineaceae bacterium]|nr:Ig-like domain-containing protein [Anaerolineaceae bacterium]
MVLRCLVCVVSLLAVLLMAFVPTGLVQAAVPVGMDGVAYEDGGFEMAQKSARDEGSTYSISGQVMDGSGIGVENVLISAAENWWQVFLPQILLGAATADRITYDHYMGNGFPPDSGNLATGTVLTDANGYYVLPSLPPGNYTLMASKNGFEITPASQTVILLSDITVQNFQAVNNNRMPHAPATPKPADGSTGVSTDTVLTWVGGDPDGDSLTYDVYFGTATVPVTLMYDNLTATSTPALSLAANTTYTWRVEAADEHGATVTSAIWQFTTLIPNQAPDAPLPSPADGSTGVSTDTILTWSGSDPDGDSLTYDVYFGTATVPVTLMYDDLTATSTPALSLATNTTYTWRVEAADEHGATVTSAIWQFTTLIPNQAPDAPSLPSPADGSTGVSTDTVLTWVGGDPDGDGVTYDVYFGTATVPVTLMYDDLTATSTPALSLATNTTYTWRVEAADEHGATVTSAIWQFTTLIPNQAPDAPSLPSPADGSTGVSTDTILTWSGSDPDGDSLTYDVYFGTATVPVTLMYDDLTATSTPALSLAANTTYTWRVEAADEHGATVTSAIWQFTTLIPNQAPDAPLPSPADGSTGVSTDTILTWVGGDPDGDGVTYDVYFGTATVPVTLMYDDLTATSTPALSLAANTTYTWRVEAADEHGATV